MVCLNGRLGLWTQDRLSTVISLSRTFGRFPCEMERNVLNLWELLKQ